MRRSTRHLFAPALAAPIMLAGCSSHLISSARPDGTCVAGMACSVNQTSIAGRQGVNSDGATGYVTRDECGNEGLTRVEVRRNFGQGLISLITLGIVSPATIHFYCAKPPPPPEPSGPGDQDPDSL